MSMDKNDFQCSGMVHIKLGAPLYDEDIFLVPRAHERSLKALEHCI